MGVPTLLTRLPGGDKQIVAFSKLKIGDEAVAFDAAGALVQFARRHAEDCMKGDSFSFKPFLSSPVVVCFSLNIASFVVDSPCAHHHH
jgi:hypothetical protein